MINLGYQRSYTSNLRLCFDEYLFSLILAIHECFLDVSLTNVQLNMLADLFLSRSFVNIASNRGNEWGYPLLDDGSPRLHDRRATRIDRTGCSLEQDGIQDSVTYDELNCPHASPGLQMTRLMVYLSSSLIGVQLHLEYLKTNFLIISC